MSFTRFHDDPCRIQKRNMEISAVNDYIFNVPGNLGGMKSHYYEDPHIRLQKTGMKQMKHMVDIDSVLQNRHVMLNRDHIQKNNYQRNTQGLLNPYNNISSHVVENTITSESRVTHPAFEYRELSQYRPQHLFYNPQNHVTIPFDYNLDTNILEKDYYNLKVYKKI